MIVANYIISAFANYGCGAYGSSTYDNNTCTSTGGSDNIIDKLANTGFDILIPIFLGVALVVAGIILLGRRAWRKHKQKKSGGSTHRPIPPTDRG